MIIAVAGEDVEGDPGEQLAQRRARVGETLAGELGQSA
jgi:hypothetical protein